MSTIQYWNPLAWPLAGDRPVCSCTRGRTLGDLVERIANPACPVHKGN